MRGCPNHKRQNKKAAWDIPAAFLVFVSNASDYWITMTLVSRPGRTRL